jgi:hypothetical protein
MSEERIPVFNPDEVENELVDIEAENKNEHHRISELREEIKTLHEEYHLAAGAPVWPFNTRTLTTFTGTVILPILLPLILHWLTS